MSKPFLPPAGRDDWGTPDWLFESLHSEFTFTVDGFAGAENAKLDRYWSLSDSAFSHSWIGERVFINPPFDSTTLSMVATKAWSESRYAETVIVLLAPVKSDQYWWHDYALRCEIRFIRGRVRFVGASSGIPFPVAVIVFGLRYPASMVGMEQRRAK